MHNDIIKKLKVKIIKKGKKFLVKVKDHIDLKLNPSKRDLHDPTKNNVEEVNCIADKLNSLQISTTKYETA